MDFFRNLGCMNTGAERMSSQHVAPRQNLNRPSYPITRMQTARSSPRDPVTFANQSYQDSYTLRPPDALGAAPVQARVRRAEDIPEGASVYQGVPPGQQAYIVPEPQYRQGSYSQAYYQPQYLAPRTRPNGHPLDCQHNCCTGLPPPSLPDSARMLVPTRASPDLPPDSTTPILPPFPTGHCVQSPGKAPSMIQTEPPPYTSEHSEPIHLEAPRLPAPTCAQPPLPRGTTPTNIPPAEPEPLPCMKVSSWRNCPPSRVQPPATIHPVSRSGQPEEVSADESISERAFVNPTVQAANVHSSSSGVDSSHYDDSAGSPPPRAEPSGSNPAPTFVQKLINISPFHKWKQSSPRPDDAPRSPVQAADKQNSNPSRELASQPRAEPIEIRQPIPDSTPKSRESAPLPACFDPKRQMAAPRTPSDRSGEVVGDNAGESICAQAVSTATVPRLPRKMPSEPPKKECEEATRPSHDGPTAGGNDSQRGRVVTEGGERARKWPTGRQRDEAEGRNRQELQEVIQRRLELEAKKRQLEEVERQRREVAKQEAAERQKRAEAAAVEVARKAEVAAEKERRDEAARLEIVARERQEKADQERQRAEADLERQRAAADLERQRAAADLERQRAAAAVQARLDEEAARARQQEAEKKANEQAERIRRDQEQEEKIKAESLRLKEDREEKAARFRERAMLIEEKKKQLKEGLGLERTVSAKKVCEEALELFSQVSNTKVTPEVPDRLKKRVDELRGSGAVSENGVMIVDSDESYEKTFQGPPLQPLRPQKIAAILDGGKEPQILKHHEYDPMKYRRLTPYYWPRMPPRDLSLHSFYNGFPPSEVSGPSFVYLPTVPPLSHNEKLLLRWYEDYFMKTEGAFLDLAICLTADFNALEVTGQPHFSDLIDLCRLLCTLVTRAKQVGKVKVPFMNAPPHAYLANDWMKRITTFAAVENKSMIDYLHAETLIDYNMRFFNTPNANFLVMEETSPYNVFAITEAFYGTPLDVSLFPVVRLKKGSMVDCGSQTVETDAEAPHRSTQTFAPEEDGTLLDTERCLGSCVCQECQTKKPVPKRQVSQQGAKHKPRRLVPKESKLANSILGGSSHVGPVEPNSNSSWTNVSESACSSGVDSTTNQAANQAERSFLQRPAIYQGAENVKRAELTTAASSSEAGEAKSKHSFAELASRFERNSTVNCPSWSPKRLTRLPFVKESNSQSIDKYSVSAYLPEMEADEDQSRLRTFIEKDLPDLCPSFVKLEEGIYAVLWPCGLVKLREMLSLPFCAVAHWFLSSDNDTPPCPKVSHHLKERTDMPKVVRQTAKRLRENAIKMLPEVCLYVRVAEACYGRTRTATFQIMTRSEIVTWLGSEAEHRWRNPRFGKYPELEPRSLPTHKLSCGEFHALYTKLTKEKKSII